MLQEKNGIKDLSRLSASLHFGLLIYTSVTEKTTENNYFDLLIQEIC